MKVLVTGVAGFIGMHVAERLLERGDTVMGIDNLNDYYDPALKEARLGRLTAHAAGDRFSFERLDIATPGALETLCGRERVDTVVHLAAQAGVRHSIERPFDYGAGNLTGFLNVLEACRRHPVAHLVYASSSSVYGGNRKLPFAETDAVDHPVSLYAATKKANELMAHSYSHLYGLPTTGLRFFTVYGPWGRPDMAYYSFARDLLAGRPLRVFAEQRMRRDFTYIDDIVDGVVAVLDKPATPQASGPAPSSAPYRIFNIGNRNSVALADFIATLEEAFGRRAVKEHHPMQAGDVEATYADIDALAAWTGFAPRTDLRTGIARFADWYRRHHDIEDTSRGTS